MVGTQGHSGVVAAFNALNSTLDRPSEDLDARELAGQLAGDPVFALPARAVECMDLHNASRHTTGVLADGAKT